MSDDTFLLTNGSFVHHGIDDHRSFMFNTRMILFLLIAWGVVRCSSTGQTIGTIWTYYPCSYIIASSTSSIHLSIDDCLNQEVTFFWHFPTGNMTLVLESDRNVSFALRFLQPSSFNANIIRNLYHLNDDQTVNSLLSSRSETIASDEQHRCSLLFEAFNQIVVDYGTFIRMTLTNDAFSEQ